MDKSQKTAFVKELNDKLQSTATIVVGHYSGLTVAQMTKLRREARAAGAEVVVAKNRLAMRAFEGTAFTNIADIMTGPTAITFSDDPVAAAKVAQNFAKDNEKFIILGGAMGESKLDANGVKSLASMPSLDELRAKLVGLISAPATKMATVTQEPAAKLARVLALKGEAA